MNKKNIPIVTTILIIINIAVFLVMEFTGSTENTQFLYEHGAMYWDRIHRDTFHGLSGRKNKHPLFPH